MNYRMIAYSVGRILVAVAATMLAPLGLSLLYGESIALAYVIPIVISVLIGLCVSAKAPKNKSLYAVSYTHLIRDTKYYDFGDNKTEQSAKVYWDRIKKGN